MPSASSSSSLTRCAALLLSTALITLPAVAETTPEQDELTLGFIKLTDMAPLAIAAEKGFFEDEGLFVTLEAQSNWKVLLDRTISGEIDGAMMLAGQPLAASIGYGTAGEVITPVALDLNGNAITVANAVWEEMKPHVTMGADGKPAHPISAAALKPVVEARAEAGEAFNLGMVFPVSTHNYELRYWLAAGGIHPGFYEAGDVAGQTGGDVLISVTPPPQMPATLEAGTILGYAVGEPWNQAAVKKGIGVPVIADADIFAKNPEKVFGLTRAFAEANPNTTIALTKALIRAGMWLDASPENRLEAVEILSRPEYVGADKAVIANSMTGTFEYEAGDIRPAADFNLFFRENATFPYYSDAVWTLTQMRRWGQIAEAKPDAWYDETAKRVYRPDLYKTAAEALIAQGLAKAEDFDFDADGYREATSAFIDGVSFDGTQPNAYIDSLKIGLKASQTPADAAVN
ncbi:MAG: ABC transporter substrate-binding protein [Gemmobacter sp.]|uniref:CmpA/NrtA family ABC transporter substrate-binding protein n=1 Tax=Gemmobacter sp. TaxID=1898957 RepID=UPI001A37DEC7|nr:CmpA/NrtA family ABC transporter substrate-binding protein [Gemmobacter sp.]MBL8563325.1 ABC transporter substrate-binding protein [Gemmobacter sp.]